MTSPFTDRTDILMACRNILRSNGVTKKGRAFVMLALGGLNAALRDYAKLGYLYLNGGRLHGKEVVPGAWVRDSLTPDAPHLIPGEDNPLSTTTWGYGYQWWIPTDSDGEFMAVGVHNQFIYVYPKENLVIVKNTANHNYNRDRGRYKDMDLAFFRTIASLLQ